MAELANLARSWRLEVRHLVKILTLLESERRQWLYPEELPAPRGPARPRSLKYTLLAARAQINEAASKL